MKSDEKSAVKQIKSSLLQQSQEGKCLFSCFVNFLKYVQIWISNGKVNYFALSAATPLRSSDYLT